MAKLNRIQLSKLRRDYLIKREELLARKVSNLSVKLYDRVVNDYLAALQTENGALQFTDSNLNLINGIDSIYNVFQQQDNIPVINKFTKELQGVIPLNERYFKNIAKKNVKAEAEKVTAVVNRRLGITPDGVVIEGGFVDRFIKDKTMLKDIKKQTIKAVSQGKTFTQFRQDMREYLQGNPKVPRSGRVHQYYRNYAYDTYQQTDRLTGNEFAIELDLRYFIYQGGTIATTRNLCFKCNNKIIDSKEFRTLTYDSLKSKYREGVPSKKYGTWRPMIDLGGFGCRHSVDWIADGIALAQPEKILNVNELKG